MRVGDAGGYSKVTTDTGLKEPSKGSRQPYTHTSPFWILRTPKGGSRDQMKLNGTFASTGPLP